MPVSYTPRLGLPIVSAAGDPKPGRVGTNTIHQNLEDRVTSYTVGLISTAGSPVAGAFRWDGQVLWWADPTMADADDGTVQGWAPVSSDAYIDVRQYGAVPLTVTRTPTPPGIIPPNYDPYALYRAADAGPGIQAAINAAIADPASDQFPGRWRRRKPIFIPPGTYAMFTPVEVTGDPTMVYKSDISIIGAFPSTHLMVFDDVMGTDAATLPFLRLGFPNDRCVVNVVGAFSIVHVDGLVLDGYTPSTRVLAGVAAEADVSVDISNIITEQNLVCEAGAVDGSHGAATPDLEKIPCRFRNITARSPILPPASRTGARGPLVRTLCAVSAGSGAGAVLENVHAVGTDLCVFLKEWGSRFYSGPDVHIEGLTCDNVAVTDIHVEGIRRLSVNAYRSVGGARCFEITAPSAMIRGSISGTFDATTMGYNTETATQKADIGRLGNGTLSIAQLTFDDFAVVNPGTQLVTIRCDGLSTANHVHMANCEWPNNPDDVCRVVTGGAPVFTYTSFRRMSNGALVSTSLDRFIPAPGVVTLGAPTATSAAGIVISDASTASDLAKTLGEVLRALKAKGIMP